MGKGQLGVGPYAEKLGAPAADPASGVSPFELYNKDNWYMWCVKTGTAEPSFQSPVDDVGQITAAPRVFTRAGVITHIGWRVTGGQTLHVSIYDNLSSMLPAPNSRLYNSGGILAAAAAAGLAVNLRVAAGDVRWLAIQVLNAGSYSASAMGSAMIVPFLGQDWTPGGALLGGRRGYRVAYDANLDPPATWNLGTSSFWTTHDSGLSCMLFRFLQDA